MDCSETRRLVEAYIDGELEADQQAGFETHLKSCPACAAIVDNATARRRTIREQLPRFNAPASLLTSVRATLQRETPAPPLARPVAVSKPTAAIIFPIWRVMGIAASVALALFAGYGWGVRRAESTALFNDAIADHVRSLQANHLMDVISTDQHTVKPWFAGKLDFSAPVVDLASVGFPLAGGRLEHIDGRTAAGLVYRRRLHAVNLFVWPATEHAVAQRLVRRYGFTAESWSRGDLNFLAVSEIPSEDLTRFVDAYRAALQ